MKDTNPINPNIVVKMRTAAIALKRPRVSQKTVNHAIAKMALVAKKLPMEFRVETKRLLAECRHSKLDAHNRMLLATMALHYVEDQWWGRQIGISAAARGFV